GVLHQYQYTTQQPPQQLPQQQLQQGPQRQCRQRQAPSAAAALETSGPVGLLPQWEVAASSGGDPMAPPNSPAFMQVRVVRAPTPSAPQQNCMAPLPQQQQHQQQPLPQPEAQPQQPLPQQQQQQQQQQRQQQQQEQRQQEEMHRRQSYTGHQIAPQQQQRYQQGHECMLPPGRGGSGGGGGRNHGSVGPTGLQGGNLTTWIPQGYGNSAVVPHPNEPAATTDTTQPVVAAPQAQHQNAPSYRTRSRMAVQPPNVRQRETGAAAPAAENGKKSPHTGSNMLRQLQRQLQQHVQRQQQQQQQQKVDMHLPLQFQQQLQSQHQQQLQPPPNNLNHLLTKRNSVPAAAEGPRGDGEETKRRRGGRRGKNPTPTDTPGRSFGSPRVEVQNGTIATSGSFGGYGGFNGGNISSYTPTAHSPEGGHAAT
ncbi:hypothetical protein VaNZ11_005097, partial [Volvox africanus]